MTEIQEITRHWLGLCRKPPGVHALRPGFCFPPEPGCAGQPDGSSGGSGSVCRGIGSAISAMKTLNRNRNLLWFTLFIGLVFAGSIICQSVLGYITWNMQPGETEWIVLTFIIEFATLASLMFLLTGLVLSVSHKKEVSASFSEGLAGAKKYGKTIIVWSVVLSLAAMSIFSLYFYSPDWLPRNHPFPTILGTLFGSLINPLIEYPFNPTFSPYTFFDPTSHGGFSPAFWIYPSGIMQALIFSEINLLLFILTPFVIPFIVIEQKNIRDAFWGSFTMMKKNWNESAACAIFLGGCASGVFLTYLLVQAASGMVTPGGVATIRPETTWIAFALVYDSALFCSAMVMATIAGIAALDLYTSAKSRQIATKSTEPGGVVT